MKMLLRRLDGIALIAAATTVACRIGCIGRSNVRRHSVATYSGIAIVFQARRGR